MKLYVAFLPLTLGLAAAGAYMLVVASRPPRPNYGFSVSEPRHWVTQPMEVETAAMANRELPEIRATGDHGQAVDLAHPAAARPQFVLFIKSDCVCSVNAQPLFNRLAARFQGAVAFVGVIDGDAGMAADYASQFKVDFPVVADPSLAIIHAYGARAGVYSVLIARNGHVVRMWPGYSANLLRQMNDILSKASGEPERPFDPQYAPVRKATGCAYPQP